MKKEKIDEKKVKEYLEDEKVKRNLDLYNNHQDEFKKEIDEFQNGSFTSIIKEIIKNRRALKKKKNHKSLKTK